MTGHDLDCSVSANFKDQRLDGQQIDHQIYLENSNILWLWTLILISSWKALFLKEIKIKVWKWPRLSSLLKENICTCNSQKQRYFKSMWRKPKWMVVLFFVLSRGWGGGGWQFKFLLRDEITTIKMSASDFYCTTNTEWKKSKRQIRY